MPKGNILYMNNNPPVFIAKKLVLLTIGNIKKTDREQKKKQINKKVIQMKQEMSRINEILLEKALMKYISLLKKLQQIILEIVTIPYNSNKPKR